ncbi:MAG: heavy-metal-associated domain-containing protein [Roseococcus sp.]|nr:heavy-metal-associated domain-containing protein [Roseococcus sp.]
MAVVELTLSGLSCGHCVQAVTAAIQARDPGARVEIALPSGALRAETALSPAEVAEAVAAEGYSAR